MQGIGTDFVDRFFSPLRCIKIHWPWLCKFHCHTLCRTAESFNSWTEHKIQQHFTLTMKSSWQSWQRTRSSKHWTNLWFSVVVPPNLGLGKQGHCTASFHAVSALWIKKELQSAEPQIQHLSPVNSTTSLKELKQEKDKYNCYREKTKAKQNTQRKQLIF